MHWTSEIDPKVKEIELRKQPVIIRVNKFDENSAKKFALEMAAAHCLRSILNLSKFWQKFDYIGPFLTM